MIDEFSSNRTGWARFSDDRKLRYRLARAISEEGRIWMISREVALASGFNLRRVCFLMLNPSTADAFKLDPTISKCCQFAQRWGADVLEVVNLFALRSTDPKGLDTVWPLVGADEINDAEILAACTGATRVIAAWGNHAHRGERGAYVRKMLVDRGIKLEHLGTTKEGYPLHPLARGKAWIPLTREPEVWAP